MNFPTDFQEYGLCNLFEKGPSPSKFLNTNEMRTKLN